MSGIKGISGRKKGVPNKVTTAVRQMLSDYIHGELTWINENLHTLDVNQRLTLFTRVLPFVIPRNDETETPAAKQSPPTIIFTKELKKIK
jgi:hypothetical protein